MLTTNQHKSNTIQHTIPSFAQTIISRVTELVLHRNRRSSMYAKRARSVVRKEMNGRPLVGFKECLDSSSALKLLSKFENSFLRRNNIILVTSEWTMWEMRCGWEAAETALMLPPAGPAAKNDPSNIIPCLLRRLIRATFTTSNSWARRELLASRRVTAPLPSSPALGTRLGQPLRAD
jgi:hypothetical protein